MSWRFHRVLMAPADDGAAGGGAASGGGEAGGGSAAGTGAAAGAGDAGAGGGNAAAPGAGAAPGNVLAAGAPASGGAAGGAAGAAGGAAADPYAWLPEKHRVVKDDTTLDIEASARKVADAYGALERRLGSGDAPPASADGYKVTVPEALADKIKADELAAAPDFKAFLTNMHALGLSQKQLDGVTAVMLERGVKMRDETRLIDKTTCEADLRKDWPTDADYSAKLQSAFQAGQAYGGKDFDGLLKDYGNDPRFVRMLASIGAELHEDTSAAAEASQLAADSLDKLMSDPAYLNAMDPKHAAIVERVNAMQAKVAGTKLVEKGRTMSFRTG